MTCPRTAAVASAAAAVLGGCVDFGYDARRYVEPDAGLDPDGHGAGGGGGGGQADAGGADGASPDSAPGTDTSPCVEGEAPPSDTGPGVRFITLNVDQALVKIAPGDTLTWTNSDSMRHTVVAGAPGAELPKEKGGFRSPELAPGGEWAFRFCAPRKIVYFCGTHPAQMNNYRIVVE